METSREGGKEHLMLKVQKNNNNLQTNKKNQANLAELISSRSHILWHSDIQRLYLRIRRVNHHELGSDDPLVQ